MKMSRAVRYLALAVGALLVAAGIGLFVGGGEPPRFATTPFDGSIRLVAGAHIRGPFTIEKAESYTVQIEFPSPRNSRNPTRLEETTDRIDAMWQVLKEGKAVASGRSHERTWFQAGDSTGKLLGDFRASPGVYFIDATVVSVPFELQNLPARLLVLLNQNSMTDLGYTLALLPVLRYVGVSIALLGAVLFVIGWLAGRHGPGA